jgi:hypothetical protein
MILHIKVLTQNNMYVCVYVMQIVLVSVGVLSMELDTVNITYFKGVLKTNSRNFAYRSYFSTMQPFVRKRKPPIPCSQFHHPPTRMKVRILQSQV